LKKGARGDLKKIIMEFIRQFKYLGKNDTNLAGGKGASLGEMTKADIPVPSGFVILTSAFNNFLEETGLLVKINNELNQTNYNKFELIDATSSKIQNWIIREQMPRAIRQDIEQEFKVLKAKFVAVRSSATSEDSPTDSWAGQLESYLNTSEK